MPIMCYLNPTDLSKKFYTAVAGTQPTGWVLTSGSDGAPDEAVKVYTAGLNNQGAGQVGSVYYDGDPGQRVVQPHWPNGILGAFSGNDTAAK